MIIEIEGDPTQKVGKATGTVPAEQVWQSNDGGVPVLSVGEFRATNITALPLCQLKETGEMFIFGQPLEGPSDVDQASAFYWVERELCRPHDALNWEDLGGLIISPGMLMRFVELGVITVAELQKAVCTGEYAELTFTMPEQWCQRLLYKNQPLEGRALPSDRAKSLRVMKSDLLGVRYGRNSDVVAVGPQWQRLAN